MKLFVAYTVQSSVESALYIETDMLEEVSPPKTWKDTLKIQDIIQKKNASKHEDITQVMLLSWHKLEKEK